MGRTHRSRAPRPSRATLPALDPPPQTILDWLTLRFPRIPRETWHSRMRRGLVTEPGGHRLTPQSPYRPHLQILYYREVVAEPAPLGKIEILHTDDHLVVADKPPFLPVTPGGPHVRSCLLYRLEEMLGIEGLAPAHRLDRGTSGVVLFVRRREERKAYGALFAHRRIERTYQALAEVPEKPSERTFHVASHIARGTPFFRMAEVDGEPNAWTDVELLRWRSGQGRFELRPASGKQHQLRLHMARLGWPILGDRLYPHLLPEAPIDPSSPLRLVAKRLRFVDPVTGTERCFESPRDPADL